MFILLLFPVVLMGIAELSLLIEVGGEFGAANTLFFCMVSGIAGLYFAKKEGMAVIRRMQKTLSEQILPACEIVDGVIIFCAGALLIFPGFITDIAGVILLIRPLRTALRNSFFKRAKRRGNWFEANSPNVSQSERVEVKVYSSVSHNNSLLDKNHPVIDMNKSDHE